MLYLLDASTLINAHRNWYALNRVPEFWRWILHHAEAGTVKLPSEVYTEVENGDDDLAAWMKDTDHKKALRLTDEADLAKVQIVLANYGEDLSEADLIKIGQDPFLIAAALGHPDRRVVTAEVSKPNKQGANRKVPNICEDCGVLWRSPSTLSTSSISGPIGNRLKQIPKSKILWLEGTLPLVARKFHPPTAPPNFSLYINSRTA